MWGRREGGQQLVPFFFWQRLVVRRSAAKGAFASSNRIKWLVFVVATERLGLAKTTVGAFMFPRVNFKFVVLKVVVLTGQKIGLALGAASDRNAFARHGISILRRSIKQKGRPSRRMNLPSS